MDLYTRIVGSEVVVCINAEAACRCRAEAVLCCAALCCAVQWPFWQHLCVARAGQVDLSVPRTRFRVASRPGPG